MRRRLATRLFVVLGILLGATPGALAYFTATGAGTAQATIATISAPSSVTAQQSGGTITISWGAAALSSGGAVQGYRVMRSDGSTVCGSPSLVTTLSCTDNGLPLGTYTYTVTAIYNSWDASATSGAITVLTAPTIAATPPSPSANRAPSFGFSGGGGTSYQCSLDGGTFSACSSPRSYSALADGSHTFRVHAAQGSSTGPDATYTWTIDGAAPTITSSPPSATASTSASFSFSDLESSYAFKCQLDGAGYAACISPTTYTSLASGSHTFKVEAFSTDGATTAAASYTWVVDTVSPTQSLTLATGTSGAFLRSSTVYYKGNASGSLELVDTVSDSGSGPGSAGFPDIATTGWTHAAETVTTPAGGPYTSSAVTWGAGPGNPGAYTVTGKDAAGNSVTTTLSFVSDTTAPSGGVLSVNGTAATAAGSTSHATTTSFAIGSRTDYAETQSSTQSGLQSSILTIQSETFSADACGVPGSGGPYTTATTVTGTTNPAITSGYCYLYTLTGSDNVGNTASVKTTVQVDATAPTNALSLSNQSGGGSFLSGNNLYFQGSTAGSFKITNSLTDANSGPASSTFATLTGTTGGWTFTGSTVTTPAGGPYVSNAFSWNNGNNNAPSEQVSGTDVFGNTSASVTLSLVNDSTPPSGGTVSVPAYSTGPPVSVTFTAGTDSQSGVATSTGKLLRASAPYSSSTDTCGSFGGFGQVGGTGVGAPYSDSSANAGHCYEYEYTVSDRVGNSVTYGPSTPVKVDSTSPTVTALSSLDSGGATADGLLQAGDQLILTFAEPLNPATVASTFTATTQSATCPITSGAGECRSSTTGDVQLVIPGVTTSAGVDTGSAGYLTGTGAQTVGMSGTIALSSGNTVVTLTVVSVNPLGGAGVGTGSGKLAFSPASTITDNAGNGATGTFNSPGNFKLF